MKPASKTNENQTQHSFWRRFFKLPSTRAGVIAIGLALAFFIFLTLFFGLVAAGQRGGNTFFSNPWLAICILLAAVSAIGSGGWAIAAIFWENERSILGFASLILGIFVLWFVIMEIAFPH